MSTVTIQVLEGLERGTVFDELEVPISIGREDDNIIRLNDERVSRFHAKIQFDGDQLILTDLDSTNGTRVNGYPVQMRILRIGDQVSIGRCLLLVGSPDEIDSLATSPPRVHSEQMTEQSDGPHSGTVGDDFFDDPCDLPGELFPQGPPPLPRELRPVQRAEVSDLVSYVHEQVGHVALGGRESEDGEQVVVDRGTWQRMLKLQMEMATHLRSLANPDE